MPGSISRNTGDRHIGREPGGSGNYEQQDIAEGQQYFFHGNVNSDAKWNRATLAASDSWVKKSNLTPPAGN
jgi:hypothetical protein